MLKPISRVAVSRLGQNEFAFMSANFSSSLVAEKYYEKDCY